MRENIFKSEYKKLNTKQQEAVENIYGQIMVVAGPGTGKTQIIGLRTANIILKGGINPENILITTFTEAGVIAIKNRLLKFLGNDAYKVNVSTIHSFSQDVIKSFPEKFSSYNANTPIDDIDIYESLKEILDNLITEGKIEYLKADNDNYFYLYDIKSRISTLKQEGISYSKLNIIIEKQIEIYKNELDEIKPTLKKYSQTEEKQIKHIGKLKELLLIYKNYNTYLKNKGYYDFNDMINFVLEKITDDDELKYYYAEKFQFIMIDEFQDSNNAQNEIFKTILSVTEDPNIMVVGDDDQSIYRFAGANIENMLTFSNTYVNTNFIVLDNNYRSNQNILDISKSLIDNNTDRLSSKVKSINKDLISSGVNSDKHILPKLYKGINELDEENFILTTIKELNYSGLNLNDIAIIVRSNKEVENWSNLLQSNGFDVDSKLKSNILKSELINFLLNVLKLINDPFSKENYIYIVDLFKSDLSGLNKVDLYKINRFLYIKNYQLKYPLSIIDVLNDFQSDLIDLGINDLDKFIELKDKILKLHNFSVDHTFLIFFHKLLEELDIINYIDKNLSFEDKEDLFTLFNLIKEWNYRNKELNIDYFINRIDLYKIYNYPIDRQITKIKKSGVNIMTAHASKGLEYDTVFIPGLYSNNWDKKRVIDKLKLPSIIIGEGLQDTSDSNIEEIRRLFYVAITRAKNNLFLSLPLGIGTKPLLISQFISEIEGYYENQANLEIKNTSINNLINSKLNIDVNNISDIEFSYIEAFLENYKLSPSDLNVFLDDPLDFLNRVVYKYPFIDNVYTIFGKTYHKTLENFFNKFKKEDKLPDLEYLKTNFYAILKEEILKPSEFELLLKKGNESLEGYYDSYKSSFKIPYSTEVNFSHKNIYFNGIPLTGTIDKIDLVNSDKNDFIKKGINLIDYKTGSTKTLNYIKGLDRFGNIKEGEGKYFRQLLFYKLLCELDNDISSKFNVENLVIDFVEGKDGKFKQLFIDYNSQEYNDFKNLLIDSWIKISDINFWKELLKKDSKN